MMGRLSGLPIFILTNYNLAVRVPLTAIPNRESRGTRPPCRSRAEPLSRSQTSKSPHEVRQLRAEHDYSARRRAVKLKKALKGCGGKQEFSPTSNI